MNFKTNKKGVTLLELMVICVIAGGIFAGIINNFNTILKLTASLERRLTITFLAENVMSRIYAAGAAAATIGAGDVKFNDVRYKDYYYNITQTSGPNGLNKYILIVGNESGGDEEYVFLSKY